MYRATPITQRDGSQLQNSNCRMASIATGIDFHTLGATTSTGARMRARQDDQQGGTDAGDAKQAWASYDKYLNVRDGDPFAKLLDYLRAGHLVHIDVWHAATGGPCLSGSGNYGHTMAVAPEQSGTRWLVSDPWCKPAKWTWVEEAKLRQGAERWGGEVTSGARKEPDWEGADHNLRQRIYARIARRLMRRWYPGNEADDDLPDTGGGGAVMFTITAKQAGDDAMGIYWNPARWTITKAEVPVYADTSGTDQVTKLKKGAVVTTFGARAVTDADGRDTAWKAVLVNTGGLVPGTDDPAIKAILWVRSSDLPTTSDPTSGDWDNSIWAIAHDPTGRYPAPPPPEPEPDPEPEDCATRVAAAIALRDDEWAEWMLTGSPGSETG